MYPSINNKNALNNTSDSSELSLTETKEGYHLEMEISGYIKDDFNLYFNNNDLVLTTAKSEETISSTKTNGNITKHSYCYASAFFKKIIHLPFEVSKNDIIIDYKNHILSIDLLKSKKVAIR